MTKLNLTQDKFRKLCIMLGTDFNKKTSGISHLKMMNNLDKTLTQDQKITFNMFKLQYMLNYKDNIKVIHEFKNSDRPNIINNDKLIEFLEDREFKKLVLRITNI